MSYCVIPRDLARDLHDLLRGHFRDDSSIVVIVERRGGHNGDLPPLVGRVEQRAPTVRLEAPGLPDAARRYAGRLVFFKRVEPTGRQAEDREAGRLARRVQMGEHEAYGPLYLNYFDRVYGYLRRMAGGDIAEELAQDVFVNAFRALSTEPSERDAPFRTWLFAIARNRLTDHLRRRGRIRFEDLASIEHSLASADDPELLDAVTWAGGDELATALKELPASQREAFVLDELVGFTTPEIAALMDRTEQAVRHLQSRARRTLRARLEHLVDSSRSGSRRPMLVRLRYFPVLQARRFALIESPGPVALRPPPQRRQQAALLLSASAARATWLAPTAGRR